MKAFTNRARRWIAITVTVLSSQLFATDTVSAAEPENAQKTAETGKQDKTTSLFDGKTLDGWKVANTVDFAAHGPVKVNNGEIVLGKGKPATGIAFTKKLPRIDYEITLEARRVQGNDFFCGITFPVNKKYCSLILGGWGGGSTGLSNVDGFSAIENDTTGYTEFKQNQWYKVRLRVAKSRIQAWVDKKQIVDLKTADRKFSIWWEQEPMRPLGIATWNTTGGLRKIHLQSLAAADAKKKPTTSPPIDN